MARVPAEAVVFDFDGLILDTETPIFQAWCEVFEDHGCELTIDDWAAHIGTQSAIDPIDILRERVTVTVDGDALAVARRERTFALLETETIRPGVEDWLAEARELGLAIGIASSSGPGWLDHHLDRLGLRSWFSTVVCWGTGEHAPKPAPDLYLAACGDLGVDPTASLAVEDSPHGITAACRAGLRCVAVPNAITQHFDLGHAHAIVPSLADVSLRDAIDQAFARTAEEAARERVLRAFVVDGRLTQIPAKHGKRLVVLDLLAQQFDVGRRYHEREVNAILRPWHEDVAALRRYLVDEGFLDRERGEYWRSGGTVEL